MVMNKVVSDINVLGMGRDSWHMWKRAGGLIVTKNREWTRNGKFQHFKKSAKPECFLESMGYCIILSLHWWESNWLLFKSRPRDKGALKIERITWDTLPINSIWSPVRIRTAHILHIATQWWWNTRGRRTKTKRKHPCPSQITKDMFSDEEMSMSWSSIKLPKPHSVGHG